MDTLWKQVGLIGQDRLLKQKIFPRISGGTKRFVIKGPAGSGKTALLEWASEHTSGKTALVNGGATYATMVRAIAEAWEADIEGTKVADYEYAILSECDHTIFVDDLHKTNEKKIEILKVLSERNKVHGAMLSGRQTNEQLKQVLLYAEVLTIPHLNKKDAARLAESVCLKLGSKASAREVAAFSRGRPGRIVTFATAGEVSRHEVYLKSDKIAIAPVLIVAAAGVVLFRVLGRALGATDITLLGSAGMLVMLVIRMLVQQGSKE